MVEGKGCVPTHISYRINGGFNPRGTVKVGILEVTVVIITIRYSRVTRFVEGKGGVVAHTPCCTVNNGFIPPGAIKASKLESAVGGIIRYRRVA